jgi:hypothetical protein
MLTIVVRGRAAVSPARSEGAPREAREQARLEIVLSEHPYVDIFRGVCQMGLEGVVSKRLSSPYQSGRSTDWLKIKNPDSTTKIRAREAEW